MVLLPKLATKMSSSLREAQTELTCDLWSKTCQCHIVLDQASTKDGTRGALCSMLEPCSWIWVLWSAGEEHCGAGRGIGCPCHTLTSIIGSGGDEAGWLQILTLMKVRISVGTVPSVAMTQDGFWVYGLKLQVGRRGTKGGQGGLFVHIPLGAVISTVTFKYIRKDKSSPGCVAVLGLA